MGKKGRRTGFVPAGSLGASHDEQILAASLAQGASSFETGRYLITFKEGALKEGIQALKGRGLRIVDARDFRNQAANIREIANADSLIFPEIGVAMVDDAGALKDLPSHNAILSVDPEYFMFAADSADYLRGFARAVDVISRDLGRLPPSPELDAETVLVSGATWGLVACKVPPSTKSGQGIKIAVLDTGMDLGHPDFAGRTFFTETFVGQPVQDLHNHGTHCIGTAAGPLSPPGTTPRYGIGYKADIHVGKVLNNSGSGSQASVLAGMNWAIANRCTAISMSLGAPIPAQPSYTAAGQSALNNGCLIVAAAGNNSGPTNAPANSPTIMAVVSLDSNLAPSSFSSHGKIEIAAPGRDVFSSVPRPLLYATYSGTSMATPHVAGCAALWAETSPSLRGQALWNKLQATARALPYPASKVGSGLVQAP